MKESSAPNLLWFEKEHIQELADTPALQQGLREYYERRTFEEAWLDRLKYVENKWQEFLIALGYWLKGK